jgi:uncharacterized protein
LWISTAEVRNKLASMESKHILVVSDSCYSARFLQFRGFLSPSSTATTSALYLDSFRKVYDVKSRIALTSGGLEPVIEPNDGSGLSIFAKTFIAFLQQRRDVFPSVAVFAGIGEEVHRKTAEYGYAQQPQWGIIEGSGHQSGDFYFRPRQ